MLVFGGQAMTLKKQAEGPIFASLEVGGGHIYVIYISNDLFFFMDEEGLNVQKCPKFDRYKAAIGLEVEALDCKIL